ncbi:MAG TPA: winged helix-turn-helix domain-containing protein [Rhizomicrobium sp.]|nr:winged helix-turn-helix domain-containing protein [Rhizomicrobium sp.]
MKYGPDISIVAQLLGDPARANMVMALMSGQALSAAELAHEAGVTPPTATGHLNKLVSLGLLRGEKQGRHRFFQLCDPDVGEAVEALIAVATRAGHLRTRLGPKDEAMRHARSCYDHLGGRLAVDLTGRWLAAGMLAWRGGVLQLTRKGREFLSGRGIEFTKLDAQKRALCRSCIDWSERRPHLGGSLGAAILAYAMAEGWAVRGQGQRLVSFSRRGEENFVRWYSPAAT